MHFQPLIPGAGNAFWSLALGVVLIVILVTFAWRKLRGMPCFIREGHCKGCGYDRQRLRRHAPCPKCGRPPHSARCPRCHYDMRALAHDADCPECGTPSV